MWKCDEKKSEIMMHLGFRCLGLRICGYRENVDRSRHQKIKEKLDSWFVKRGIMSV